jgi:hypothetical protein
MPGEPPEKKTYRVWAKTTTYQYLDVEATSAEEAVRIAGTDEILITSDWETPDPYGGDWEILPDETEVVEEAS